MKTIIATLTAVSAIALAAPAAAEGWNGGYIGLDYGVMDQSGVDTVSGVGIHAGYRFDMGSAVLGVEGQSVRVSGDSAFLAKAQVGYDMGDFLPYVTAGGVTLTDVNGPWEAVYGAGVDYRVTDNMTIGAEALHYDTYDVNSVALRVNFNF